MSLRARILAWIGGILVLCLALGVVFAGQHAQRSVRVELAAALNGGHEELNDMMDRLPTSGDPTPALREAAASFDGVRHLRATLTDPKGRLILASQPLQSDHPEPRWFKALLTPRLASVRAQARGYTLTLTPIADNEAGEVWSEFVDSVMVLALFCAGAAAAIYFTLGRALKPLSALEQRFGAVMAGDLDARALEQGAPELIRLARRFNQMAEKLGETGRRNARLEEQILTLQEEERAELARDLHDEIGPHLFVMKVDAAVIRDLAAGKKAGAILSRVQSIEAALAHVQSNVRDLLGRLRPTPVAEFGLAESVENLLAFWRSKQAGIAFAADIAVDDDRLTPLQRAAVYRLVQEGLSNAVRHAQASRIDIAVLIEDDGALVARVGDDGAAGGGPPGRGLTGMRERVLATGGALSFGPDADAGGWIVRGRWPPTKAMAKARVDA
jgi:two-component system sensor histidine kinase UhpB